MGSLERQALLNLLAARPAEIQLDSAVLELARIQYPELDPIHWRGELDRHAWAIAERTPDLSNGPEYIRNANSYLFGEAGFRGNVDDYYSPDNSCLNRVLETGLGIPITLSVLYIEIARRLAAPVSGVALPGHFVVRYDGPDYRAIIDPFHGGAIIDEAQCCQLAQAERLDPQWLLPVDLRHIIMRMINNLRVVYFDRRDIDHALALLDLMIEALPDNADEHKQRAAALLAGHRYQEALDSFRTYLKLAPEAEDRERVEEQMRNLAFWMSSRN